MDDQKVNQEQKTITVEKKQCGAGQASSGSCCSKDACCGFSIYKVAIGGLLAIAVTLMLIEGYMRYKGTSLTTVVSNMVIAQQASDEINDLAKALDAQLDAPEDDLSEAPDTFESKADVADQGSDVASSDAPVLEEAPALVEAAEVVEEAEHPDMGDDQIDEDYPEEESDEDKE